MKTRDHGQCITEDTLTEYLEGGLDPAIKAVSEVHLAVCDDCRVRLGFFMRVLANDLSAEESNTLETITLHWDSRKYKSGLPVRAGTRRWLFPFAAIAAIFVAVVFLGGFWANRPSEAQSASEVVELLLAQHRPFESRLADEPHLPMFSTRGNGEPDIAYGLLAGEMTRLSADSHEMGRFYLIQKDFGRAIRYLENAEREVGSRPDVHNDLGVAYMERGDPSQIEQAATEFRHALAMDSNSLAAAFNLALLYERRNDRANAEAQWMRYLELDNQSMWASEARSRLQGISR